MANNNGKEKRIKRIPINKYRRNALYLNPIVLVILVICILLHVPSEACIAIGVVGYGVFFYFLVKANLEDRKIHGTK